MAKDEKPPTPQPPSEPTLQLSPELTNRFKSLQLSPELTERFKLLQPSPEVLERLKGLSKGLEGFKPPHLPPETHELFKLAREASEERDDLLIGRTAARIGWRC